MFLSLGYNSQNVGLWTMTGGLDQVCQSFDVGWTLFFIYVQHYLEITVSNIVTEGSSIVGLSKFRRQIVFNLEKIPY